MVKVILELPKMPENCKECLLHSWKSNGYTLSLICKILLVNGLPHKRRDDCPLKRIESSPKIPIERWTGDEREIICPACKSYICYPEDIKTIDLKYRQFCGACGQKLNWESEVEEG